MRESTRACHSHQRFVPLSSLLTFCNDRPVSVSTSLSAEWKPSDGKWEEKDFEGDLAKLEKEAEERLDAKISELMSKVETTGGK